LIILIFVRAEYEILSVSLEFKLISILTFYFSAELLFSYLSSIILGLNFYRLYTQIFIINSLIHVALLLVLLFFSIVNVENILVILLLKNFLVLCFITFKIQNYFNFNFELKSVLYTKMIRNGFIHSLALLLLSLIYSADILVLKFFEIDAMDFGIYAFTSKIIHGLCIIPQSIGTIFFSLSIKKENEINIASKIIILKFYFYFLIFSLIVLYFSLPELIHLFLGPTYQNMHNIFLLLLPGVCGLFIIKTLYPDIAGQYQVKPFLNTFVLIILLQITLNIIFISKYSIIGCAISSSISYIILATLIIKKYLKINNLKLSQLVILTVDDLKSIVYNFI
jgi:O-antigen/teichoic acid export membrane protein